MLADQHVDDPLAAECGVEQYDAARRLDDPADNSRLSTGRITAHRRKHPLCCSCRRDQDQRSFAGEVERIEAEELAGADDMRPQGELRLVDHNRNIGGQGKFV